LFVCKFLLGEKQWICLLFSLWRVFSFHFDFIRPLVCTVVSVVSILPFILLCVCLLIIGVVESVVRFCRWCVLIIISRALFSLCLNSLHCFEEIKCLLMLYS
jgi:hypothetical protein